jgi:methylated-DNA-[protein]-cysteine S-methyltransferase
MEELVIASHPKVGVKVITQGDTIERITLFLSPQFTLLCPSKKVADKLAPWLNAYASHKWSPFPLSLPKTPFAKKATSYLQNTPLGTVLSYKELAKAIGHPGAARAIGTVCSGNLFPLLIPCHRVIPSSGGLGAYTPDPKIKEELLRFEGITNLLLS